MSRSFRSSSGNRDGAAIWVILAVLVVVLIVLLGALALTGGFFFLSQSESGGSVAVDPGVTGSGRTNAYLDDPGIVGLSDETRSKRLSNFCLDGADNIIACDEVGKTLRVISMDDALISSHDLEFGPQDVAICDDDKILVAGAGKIGYLERSEGAKMTLSDIPGSMTTSVAVSGEDVFVAVRESTSYSVYHMNRSFGEQKRIVQGLRGCCGQMDIAAKDGHVFVAANVLFKVIEYDRDGDEVRRFGKKGRTDEESFKGCCEPKNVVFDGDGNLITSESDGICVKKFSPEGKYLGYLGAARGIRGCVRVTVGITSDGQKIYMLDTDNNVVRLVQQ